MTEKKKLFVGVDDSLVNREIFKEAARLCEMDVVTSENGQLAFERIQDIMAEGKIPELIITDIHMPVMNGVEFIQKIKNTPATK
ncbi:MAG: response regulator [Oligoflexia bacterium]|nr:response regulator [Oligoflexia bacterium]